MLAGAMSNSPNCLKDRLSTIARATTFAIFVIFLLAPSGVLAMMPPHVNHTVPEDGATLDGDTVEFHGYSLAYVDEETQLEVIDTEDDADAAHTTQVDCTWEGPSDGPPGSRQQKCTFHVTIADPEPGHTYRLTLLDTTIEVTISRAYGMDEEE